MNCEETKELLDAYALGALDQGEAYLLEGHVAACPECWQELDKSRRTASLLAVSVPIRRAPDHLRRRIMSAAHTEETGADRPPLLQRLRPTRRPAIVGLALAGTALVLASVLQFQLSDLRGDKNQLEEDLNAASSEIAQQRQIVAILSAEDNRKIPMDPASARSQAASVYNWSRDTAAGFLVCDNFPALPAGQVYQVWFTSSVGSEPVVSFVPNADGACQIPLDLSRVQWRPEGIGITIEREGGSARPSRDWFAYASFNESSRQRGSGLDFTVSAVGP